MVESDLTKFVRAIRLKNNISDIKAAYRCGIKLSEYILLERNIESLSMSHLKTIFEAIEVDAKEYLDFQKLVNNKEIQKISKIKLNKSLTI